MGKSGLSLLEVLVAALILALTVGGVLYIFSTEKGVVSRSGRRMQAIEFARQKLEGLKNAVGADTWPNAGDLRQGEQILGPDALTGNLKTKFPGQGLKYQVDDGPDLDSYKKVTVTIDWTEPK